MEGEGRTVAGRYLLNRHLGSGAMGRVWLAWDERIRRNVAVKEVVPRGPFVDDTADPVINRTLREAHAAAKSHHPGIVTVHDVVDHDDRPWIVMDFIDGPSLAGHLRAEGPLPVRRAAEIAIEVIEALDAAHEQGVVHRDVKPSNIMLDKKRAVLTDFGIAAIDGGTVLTLTGQLIGSPEYMAPELIDGHEATPAVDLWAVGITLYHMVIGDTPFRRATATETFGAIAGTEPAPHPGVGPLWPVIQGLLRKKPAERLTAGAAIELLREVLARSATHPPALPLKLPLAPSPAGEQDTVTHATAPDVLIDFPPMSAPPDKREPVVRPGDVTLEPDPPRPPRPRVRTRVLVGGTVLLAVVAVIVLVVVFVNGGQDTSGIGLPNSSVQGPLPTFTNYQESLGFSINVPQNYVRQASAVSAVSDVVWQAAQPDPGIGALVVQVRREDTKPGTRPIDYLSARERAESADSDNVEYRRLSLTGQGGGPAVWEYTHGSASSGGQFHARTLAVTSGNHIYALTFSLYAQDLPTLRAQWQAAQPIMDKIGDSFRVTS